VPSAEHETAFETESRAGSRELLPGRATRFPPYNPASGSVSLYENYTWVDVRLQGGPSGWGVDLEVHAPPYLMSYVREREAATAERAKSAAEQARRIVSERAKGYWTDPKTQLMWTVGDAGADVRWEAAVNYCRDLLVDGRSGWRLPEIDELEKVYDWMSGGSLVPSIQVWTDTTPTAVRLAMVIWTATKQSSGDPWVFKVFAGHRDGGAHNAGRVLCVHSAVE